MTKETRIQYADNRRRGMLSGRTKRVMWKSKSRHIA